MAGLVLDGAVAVVAVRLGDVAVVPAVHVAAAAGVAARDGALVVALEALEAGGAVGIAIAVTLALPHPTVVAQPVSVAVNGLQGLVHVHGGGVRVVAVVPTVPITAAGFAARDLALVVALEALEGAGAVAVSVAVALTGDHAACGKSNHGARCSNTGRAHFVLAKRG